MPTEQPAPDLATEIRRLIDAGYRVLFDQPLGGDYYVEVTNEFGSRWKCLGATPAEALRSNWPLGQGRGQGGCGHCGGLGCETDSCPVCAVYTDAPGNGICAVCGEGYPLSDADDGEPDEYPDAVGPDTPCRASSQLSTPQDRRREVITWLKTVGGVQARPGHRGDVVISTADAERFASLLATANSIEETVRRRTRDEDAARRLRDGFWGGVDARAAERLANQAAMENGCD